MTQPSLHSHEMIPHLRKQDSATQLIVHDQPYLIIGGELHNSSSSSLAFMLPIWERLTALHLNTVLVVVSWELVEPEEGKFEFALVDGLIHEARRHGLHIIFLWFGSWKNAMSSYCPAWVKRDYRRFPRVIIGEGQIVDILSTFSSEARNADAKAFSTLMRHLNKVDGRDHTVIMIQVQNEVGVLGDSRDRSTIANQAFAGPVPTDLIAHIEKHRSELGSGLSARWQANGFKVEGSWEEIFGIGMETDELFMAWNYARYIDAVAAAGKVEYPLPMFVNAWLSSLGSTPGGWASGGQKPGEWPSGGPLPHTLDIWQAGASHIDFLAPDIYQPNFQVWCRHYTSRGNPLFIPEMRSGEDGARQVFYALGEHDAIGVSPFAIDSVELSDSNLLQQSYAVLRQMAPRILEAQGKNTMVGFLLDEGQPSITKELGGYELEIALDRGFGHTATGGSGLIILTGQDEFIGAGFGFRVRFKALSHGPALTGILAVDEGQFRVGQWVPGRRLNGDETRSGHWWRFNDFPENENQGLTRHLVSGISRCTVYRYE